MTQKLLILYFMMELVTAEPIKECCNDNNLLVGTKCAGGHPLTITCKLSYYMDTADNETVLTTDKNNNLVIDNEDVIPPDKYCFGTRSENNQNVVILCVPDNSDEDIRQLLNTIMTLISVFFIILTIVVYLSVPEILDLQSIATMHSISGLAVAYIILAVTFFSGYLSNPLCHLVAYLMYTTFLYAFFWLNIVCFHIWKHIVKPKCLKFVENWKIVYYLYGVGGPIICLIFLLSVQHANLPQLEHIHPGLAESKCWFKSLRETMLYFYGPISILLLANVVYFIWTTIELSKQSSHCPTSKVMKYRLRLYAKLFFIMGITWIFEVISAYFLDRKDLQWLWFITDTLNGLEGLIIFLILVVFRRKVMRALANRKIFKYFSLPAEWKHLEDSECEPIEEEMNLSTHDNSRKDGII